MRRGRYERSAAVLYATIKRRGGLSVCSGGWSELSGMSSGLSERPQVELAERRRLERATAACASGSGLSEQRSSLSASAQQH